jgi:hypothetical protein
MNKLITTNNGGMPLELDDLRWTDEAYREGFKGLATMFGGLAVTDGYILSGLGVTNTGSNYSIAEGYVVFNGEIWYIPAKTLAYITTSYKYVIVEDVVFDATGNETFEDGSVNDTYQIRRAKFSQVGILDSGFDYLDGSGNIIGEYVSDKINTLTGAHTHANKAVLDAISAAGSGQIITTTERSKLASILNIGSGQIITTSERSDISNSVTRLDDIEADWLSIALSANEVKLGFADGSDSNATRGADDLRVKIIGNTMHFVFRVQNLTVPAATLGDTSTYVESIKLSVASAGVVNSGVGTRFYARAEETTGYTNGNRNIMSGDAYGDLAQFEGIIYIKKSLPMLNDADSLFNLAYDISTTSPIAYGAINATSTTNWNIWVSGTIQTS